MKNKYYEKLIVNNLKPKTKEFKDKYSFKLEYILIPALIIFVLVLINHNFKSKLTIKFAFFS